MALATAYAEKREKRLALDRLRKGLELKPELKDRVAGAPEFDFMRDDPEFLQLVGT